jgi:hypothetical protein
VFREGDAKKALAMKRADGHALLAGGDRDQVIAQVADLYINRRDMLMASGSKRGVTVSAPTNEDVADISQAIRQRLKERGEIASDEVVYRAIDQRGRTYNLPIAAGDRLRLFRRTWGTIDGDQQQIGNNGDIIEVLGHNADGLRLRTKDGCVADVEWRRFSDSETGRLLVGLGHALTIDAAQGITSDEHINALPRGTSGITAFTTYVAESRSRGTTWTVISGGALYEAERHRQALGDITPITHDDLWARAAADMSRKPYKALGIDLLAAARQDRERAVDTFIACHYRMETAQLADPAVGGKALRRLRLQALNASLDRHLASLTQAIQENSAIIRDITREREASDHLRALRAEAAAARQHIGTVKEGSSNPGASSGPT